MFVPYLSHYFSPKDFAMTIPSPITIPFSKPDIAPDAFENIKHALTQGKTSGDGPFCRKAEGILRNLTQAKHTLLTTSGTHALELMAYFVGENATPQKNEVIVPSFTFSSTTNALVLAGLKPVFCEIDPCTMNVDVKDVARKITPRTCAIMLVHYAGVACDMQSIFDLCQGKDIAILEDAAQAIGAFWKEKALGTIGDMGAFSFHDTKNIGCGEGGCFLTNNEKYAAKAEVFREKGTNRSQFFRGQVDKYTWVGKGSSYVLSDVLAALLCSQLDHLDELLKKRAQAYHIYHTGLQELEQKEILVRPVIPSYAKSNHHIYHIILPTEEKRNSLMNHLRNKGIGATFHYIPLHSAPMGRELGYTPKDLPLTESYANRLLRFPLFSSISRAEQDFILQEVCNWAKI
jgi:dTDP-4-amino-4,6-dideoxygalactose transaminase